ncbi:uncharacterized protein LOC110463135 [Mizuhopecten yessoensis]|uniref:CBM20 domain-containing protein n=1 Tax=Mizuhopecten yessoensis TaxID=6573 RepID=A0A210PWU7_MIZYE|nr:uncharacterized protein LOC110463135 [Mizuhopecten yessoensis]OWF40961.1 hypothetical protein KP79_PYT15988 [Mizuhopecten yessoensis]
MSLSGKGSSVSYLFEIVYAVQTRRDCLGLCGSIVELGLWQVEKAVVAKEIPQKSGIWFAAVDLPSRSEFCWKWVVLNEQKHAIRWEERPNRNSRTGVCHGRLQTSWNGGEILSISWKQKYQHIGIDDTGDECEEEYSSAPPLDIIKGWAADDGDILEPMHSRLSERPSTTRHQGNHPIAIQVSAQEAIRHQTTLEKPTLEAIETSKRSLPPKLQDHLIRSILSWVTGFRDFINTLIEINYS